MLARSLLPCFLMPKITFTDSSGNARTVEAEIGSTVMETAIRNNIPGIEAECGGAGNPRCSDPDSRTFERVSERRDCSRLARAHAPEQQFRLTIEELKNFPFEAAITECHAREVIAVEHRYLQRFGFRTLVYIDRGLRHLGLPAVFIGEEFGPIGIKSR